MFSPSKRIFGTIASLAGCDNFIYITRSSVMEFEFQTSQMQILKFCILPIEGGYQEELRK